MSGYYIPGGYGYGYGYGMDSTYILVMLGFFLSIIASAHVKTTFAKYSKVRSLSGMTGAMAAERILKAAGIYDVRIQHVAGNLTDHFDPRDKVVRLSSSTYNSTSVAAIGVAAHECGHVIQHEQGYFPIQIRGALVPVANLGSRLGLPMVILGLVLGLGDTLALIGIMLFSFAVMFHLVTLPVEINASRRALNIIEERGILDSGEKKLAGKVLFAAALTYVAGATASILQLVRLFLISGRGRSRQ